MDTIKEEKECLLFNVEGHHLDSLQLRTYYDEQYKVLWHYMRPNPRPCFNLDLLDSLLFSQKNIINNADNTKNDIEYVVLASDTPNVFNLGGDLKLFQNLIQNKRQDLLRNYAEKCITAVYNNYTGLNRNIRTVSLVQGDALGGGFEAALSSDILIAERGVKMGLPEILFNLFPGMGAYSLLSRKLNSAMAERLILSGKLYSAEELFDMGLVDILADKGKGHAEVSQYIKKEARFRNGINAIKTVKNMNSPVTYQELTDITEIWVSTAMKLGQSEMKILDRLVKRQNTKSL